MRLVEVNGGWDDRGHASVAYSLSSDSSNSIGEASERKAPRRVGGAEGQTA